MNLVSLAQAIYAGLPTIEVVSLAPKMLAGAMWDALTAAERSCVTSLATTALVACPEIPKVLADDAGRSLWEAVLAHAALLPGVVPAVMDGTTWGGLDKDQRLAVLKIANKILGSLADAATPASATRQAS